MRSLMLKDRKYRREVVRQSHYWFFHFAIWHFLYTRPGFVALDGYRIHGDLFDPDIITALNFL
jgi:hypothetical protein